MIELLTAAQMRETEQAAIASGEGTGLDLMERAGRGVVAAIFAEWPDLAGPGGGAAPTPPGYFGQDEGDGARRAVVLCGPGNNGGDGFVVARLLKEWGWAVEVFLCGDPARLPPDARRNHDRWTALGEVRDLADCDLQILSARPRGQPDVIVDGLFGTGLVRPLEGHVADLAVMLRKADPDRRPAVVAIDVPSGICADSGKALGTSFPADLVVTFHLPKRGHHLALGARTAPVLRVMDIGLTARPVLRAEGVFLTPGLGKPLAAALGKPPSLPAADGHYKYTYGHALILSGGTGRGGAARLAARGALRIGAGLVTVGCPPDAIPENAARLDAVMLRGVADGEALAGVLEDGRINALCLGPGMGTGAREAGLVAVALGMPVPGLSRDLGKSGAQGGKGGPGSGPGRGKHPRSLVFDADALTILSQHPDLFAALHDDCVLTPHAGEFARLFPDIAEKLAAPATKGPAYSKVDATREAAALAGCVVLFKGPDTVIADPSGRCAINSAHYDRAAPWLATAGSGDVLAGFITGLLARGFSPFDAACTAAWLHVECARSFGPGLIAEDLPEDLPKVFRALGV